MNPLRTLFIHLKGRGYRGVLKTVVRYFQVKYWKYFNKTIRASVRDREQVRLVIHPGCAVSEKLYVVGLYDREGMTTLEELMKPGEIFYDVGANIGPFSLLAHSCGASVYAFEGHPETTKRCRENFEINGLGPERAFATAVSDSNGSVSFSGVTGSSVNSIIDNVKADYHNNTIEVPVVSLDRFAETHESPTAIKIDTEGHELHVIRGMRSILKKGEVKYLTFEANAISSKSELQQIHEILSDSDFMVGHIDWDEKKFVAQSDLGEKSLTGDYIAISKACAALFEERGVTIFDGYSEQKEGTTTEETSFMTCGSENEYLHDS